MPKGVYLGGLPAAKNCLSHGRLVLLHKFAHGLMAVRLCRAVSGLHKHVRCETCLKPVCNIRVGSRECLNIAERGSTEASSDDSSERKVDEEMGNAEFSRDDTDPHSSTM